MLRIAARYLFGQEEQKQASEQKKNDEMIASALESLQGLKNDIKDIQDRRAASVPKGEAHLRKLQQFGKEKQSID